MKKLFILTLIALNMCLGQISVPLTKQTIRQHGSEYEEDSLYVFDFDIYFQDKKTSLQAIVDLQNDKNWVVDQSCVNCFSTKESSSQAFACGSQCKPVPANPPTLFLSDTLKVISQSTINAEANLDGYDISLTSVYDIFELKSNFHNPTDRLYLDNAQAGLGFSAETIKSSKTSLSQLYKKFKDQSGQKEFSLFFNSEMGRLLIGKSEQFFTNGDLKTFKIVEDEAGIQSWGVKLGPHFIIKDHPNVSTTDQDRNEDIKISGLFNVFFDSTTKYLKFPFSVWTRLNKLLFSFNGCTTDQSGNSICNCPGSSTSWVSIGFDFVHNPRESSLEKNTSSFVIEPETYLEKIEGGKSNGKCLLLIRPTDTKEAQEYYFGTTFLQSYYSIYNFDSKSVKLAKSHGFVPSALHIAEGTRLPFIILGCLLGLILILILLALLKGVKVGEAPLSEVYKPHQTTTVSYLVRSPREIESIQQITKSVRSTGPQATPIHARVISSPYKPNYTQSQIHVQQQYY